MTEATPTPAREWKEEMGEISGFGGAYEQQCRTMVLAGIAWLDANPDVDPKFRGYAGVYGVCTEENSDGGELSKVLAAAAPGCTGAMHQAAVGHCLAYKRFGWDEYCRQLTARGDK